MSKDAVTAAVTLLSLSTTVIAIAEFYGGKELQRWIKGKLEGWWIKLSYIRTPNIGEAEASFTLSALQKSMGRNLSWRRLLAIVLLTLAFYAAAIVWKKHQLGLDWPAYLGILQLQIDNFLIVTVPLVVVATYLSVAISYAVLERSLRWFSGKRLGSLYFLITVIAAAGMTMLLYDGAQYLNHEYFYGGRVGLVEIRTAGDSHNIGTMMMMVYRMTFGGLFVLMTLFLFWLRVGLLGAFAAWVVTGFALMWLRATIFRLFEAEKGALTIFSAVITAGVAALKWWGTAPA